MKFLTLKKIAWIEIIVLFVASFITVLPRPSYAVSLDLETVVKKLVGYGVPAIVMIYLVATSGLYGAAAIIAALSTLGGPWGMIGGIVTIVVLKDISEWIAEFGMRTLMRSVVKDLKKEGKSKREIKKEIESYSLLSASMKLQIINEAGLN